MADLWALELLISELTEIQENVEGKKKKVCLPPPPGNYKITQTQKFDFFIFFGPREP